MTHCFRTQCAFVWMGVFSNAVFRFSGFLFFCFVSFAWISVCECVNDRRRHTYELYEKDKEICSWDFRLTLYLLSESESMLTLFRHEKKLESHREDAWGFFDFSSLPFFFFSRFTAVSFMCFVFGSVCVVDSFVPFLTLYLSISNSFSLYLSNSLSLCVCMWSVCVIHTGRN